MAYPKPLVEKHRYIMEKNILEEMTLETSSIHLLKVIREIKRKGVDDTSNPSVIMPSMTNHANITFT